MQQPTPENLKAEMARHRIRRAEICDLIGMHPNQLSQYVNVGRTLTPWAAHNIGWAINTLVRQDVFNVDMHLRPLAAPRGRPPVRRTLPRRRTTAFAPPSAPAREPRAIAPPAAVDPSELSPEERQARRRALLGRGSSA